MCCVSDFWGGGWKAFPAWNSELSATQSHFLFSPSLVAPPLAPPPPSLALVLFVNHWGPSLVRRMHDSRCCSEAQQLVKEVSHPLLCQPIHWVHSQQSEVNWLQPLLVQEQKVSKKLSRGIKPWNSTYIKSSSHEEFVFSHLIAKKNIDIKRCSQTN